MKNLLKKTTYMIFITGALSAGDFVYFLVDSSKNGYGAFLENNNPLGYSYDANGDGENAGWVAVYRQFGTMDETAGFLGVAQSDPYGEQWFVESRINTTYPENQTYTISSPGLPTRILGRLFIFCVNFSTCFCKVSIWSFLIFCFCILEDTIPVGARYSPKTSRITLDHSPVVTPA